MTTSDVALFSRELAALLRMDYDLPEAVARIESGARAEVKPVLDGVRQKLLAGSSLTDAVESGQFPATFVRGVSKAADKGDLILVLERMADMLENDEWRRINLGAALVYPRLLLTMAVLLGWLLLGPLLHFVFASKLYGDIPMPLLTFISFTLSNFLVSVPGTLVVLLIAVGVNVLLSPRYGLSRWWPLLPVIGPWIAREDALTWCLWMDHLITSGAALGEAVPLAAQACISGSFIERMRKVGHRLSRGSTLGDSLETERVLPASAAWLVAQAEVQQFAPGTLRSAAHCLERSVTRRTGDALTLLEPLCVGFVGLMVAAALLTIFLPLYTLIGQIH